MIELRDVSVVAGAFSLSGMSLSLERGEFGVLMGKTGCGKTTLLESICGLREIVGGEIILDGREVTSLPPAKRRTGFVPQDLALFSTMTVRQHLEFGPRRYGLKRKEIAKRVAELSEMLGIEDLLQRRPKGLSGGEAQRVALGRALAYEPANLLMDEPFSSLDEWTREEIYDLLTKVRQTTGVTVLHITHSRAEAELLGDRRFLLEEGELRESG